MLLLIISVVVTMAEVSSALQILQLDKSRSWLSWLGNDELILVFVLVLMPSAMVCVVAFGVITTTLDRLLATLEGFCDFAESMVACGVVTVDGKNETRNPAALIKVQSWNRMSMNEQNDQARGLLEQFFKLKSLFLTYNKLIGPLTLVMVFMTTVSTIHGISDVLQSKDGRTSKRGDWEKWAYLARYALFLSILDRGHRAKALVSAKRFL